MPRDIKDRIRQANSTKYPEESVALRCAVLGAVMTAAIALFAQGAIGQTRALAMVAALPLAFWVSWRRRAKDNWHIKLALTGVAIVALVRFLGGIRAIATLDEARFPLAELFLWVQVIHGFDVPARKDLYFSLGSSLALMAVAGTLSQDLSFLPFLVIYFAFAIASLVLGHASEVAEGADGSFSSLRHPRSRAGRWAVYARATGVTGLAAAMVFLVLPQPQAVSALSLPFKVGSGLGLAAGEGITNPGFGDFPSARSSGTAYYGFSDHLDLRVRGDLSDDIVMRIRASAPALWKGMIFDTYDGTSWTGAQGENVSLGVEPPYPYPLQFRSLGPRADVTQTFYVEQEQPNVIFAAGQPETVWFDGGVEVDELGGLRTSSTLTPGTVYSVVSSRGAASPDELRTASGDTPPAIERYLQLPRELPARVSDLANKITRTATSTYDKVAAVEAYMRNHYHYRIDSPVPPIGRDAVDHFLFDTDVGFCEQFASATAVLLRTLGIPARVVAGYASGSRNPFTGYYEVRASDAHTWVEVWFPRFGWYEFDPTLDVPPATVGLADLIPLVNVLRGAVAALASLGRALPSTGAIVVAVAAVLSAIAMVWIVRRRRPHDRPRAPAVIPRARGAPVAHAWGHLEAALATVGRGRRTSETASELMVRTGDLARPAARAALEAFERERYGHAGPPAEAVAAAIAELESMAASHLGGVPAPFS